MFQCFNFKTFLARGGNTVVELCLIIPRTRVWVQPPPLVKKKTLVSSTSFSFISKSNPLKGFSFLIQYTFAFEKCTQ